MKNLITAFFILAAATMISAQNTVTWKGGTPGNETSWTEASNWSNNKVPNEFSKVVIKAMDSGHYAQPVIKGFVEVASIEIQAGANVTVEEEGTLIIEGAYNYTQGITFYGGSLTNKGEVNLNNIDEYVKETYLNSVQGKGEIFIDGQKINGPALAQK